MSTGERSWRTSRGRTAVLPSSHSRICGQQKASALAYFDVFLLLAVVTAVLVPVVLLMKRSVAEKGAHIGQE